MKLIIKITLLFMLISLLVFALGATITYNAMSEEIEKEEKWFLEERLQSMVNFLERRQPDRQMVRDKMVVTPLSELVPEQGPFFSDTLVMHVTLQRLESHLKLDAIRHAGNKAYQIMIYDLIIEEDDIQEAVQEAMVKTYLILFLVSILLSFIASYFVFKPFQVTLQAIRSFSLKDSNELKLPGSSTSEFKKLNLFIEEMSRKARRDYQSLKEFSENASHEIQTPLSIAQGKLELLMESENLTGQQMELINSAQEAIRRLSKMGNSLALLTKIENREFSDFEPVDLSQIVTALLFDFNELIELKSIKTLSEVSPDVKVKGNKVLLEILVTNLLNNAVRHNFSGGEIRVLLNRHSLRVINTGMAITGSTEELFHRFKKGSDNPDSFGLGLSIVKKICDEHHFLLKYHAENEQHELTVSWAAEP